MAIVYNKNIYLNKQTQKVTCMQSRPEPPTKTSAKETIPNDTRTRLYLLSFLNINDHMRIAPINRTFLKQLTEFYQTQLKSLEKKLNPQPKPTGNLATIPFPTSGYLFNVCHIIPQAPSLFIHQFIERGQKDLADKDTHPIITL